MNDETKKDTENQDQKASVPAPIIPTAAAAFVGAVVGSYLANM